ncbi:hypothetical protein [Streptomyces caelestis]|jgi:hypothetical protein|uniref:Uncharacterized protein n=1 Tax=Streptomyces caelestis TaxID=36816 RepID=A0A7W9HCH7_9ACTN|nr:hypothetical protein [Streptomyces caelestis]MBB5799419.1 hypothetical protein [Streptomyces caelestis]
MIRGASRRADVWLNRGNGKGGFDSRSQVGKITNWSDVRIS